jgi:hypothetical protein
LVFTLLFGWIWFTSLPQAFSATPVPGDPINTEPTQRSSTDLNWVTTTFDLSAGYRRDKLAWHIAGNLQGTNPNGRSELTWSDLDI